MQAELRNGIITGYTIKYQSLTENDNGVVQAGPNDRQANLTGLKKFVEYNISVIAFTVKGGGPPNFTVVRTDQDSKSYNTFIIIINLLLLLLQSVSAFVFLFVCFFGLVNKIEKKNVKSGKYYSVPLACLFFTLVPRLTLYLFIRTGGCTTTR